MYKIINICLFKIVVIYHDIVFERVEMDLNAIATYYWTKTNIKHLNLIK
jgi:hypothetical protein